MLHILVHAPALALHQIPYTPEQLRDDSGVYAEGMFGMPRPFDRENFYFEPLGRRGSDCGLIRRLVAEAMIRT